MSYFNFAYRNNENKNVSVTSRAKQLGQVIDDFETFLKAAGFNLDNMQIVLESKLIEEEVAEEATAEEKACLICSMLNAADAKECTACAYTFPE